MFPKKNQTVLKVEALESRWMPAGMNPGQLLESVHGGPDGIVFVDKSLVNKVPVAEFGEDLVVAVDGQSDPVEQMGAVIRAGDGIRSVRIISHGSDGTIWLGGRAINSDYLLSRTEEISEWAGHLSDDADLLLYGCDVASNESGKEYAGLWSSLTGADVAASNDATGVGGDLTLEYVTGAVSVAPKGTLGQWEDGDLSLGVLPNERTGAGAVWAAGSGKQFPNFFAYAVLNKDGTISAWGDQLNGGSGVPEGNTFVEIVSNYKAFTAIRSDGTVVSWGNKEHGGGGAPLGVRFKEISATGSAFAGLKEDGSIVVWGNPKEGGAGAPAGNDFVKVYSGAYTFTAMRKDGSLITWAEEKPWGIPWKAPEGTGFKEVFSTTHGLSAVKNDGTAYGWGDWSYGWANETTPFKNVKTIASTHGAFTALHFDGTVTSWASAWWGNQNVPTESGFTEIFSNGSAFAALKNDGSLRSWGHPEYGGKGAPYGNNYSSISSTGGAFAAITADGSIESWGAIPQAPTGKGFKAIYANNYAFAALKEDGSIKAWGLDAYGGAGAPTDSGYVHIFSNLGSFAAVKADGTIVTWGDQNAGGKGAPSGNVGLAIQSTQVAPPYFAPGMAVNLNASTGVAFSANGAAKGLGISYTVATGELPAGLSLNAETGQVQGTPVVPGSYQFAIKATNSAGSAICNLALRVGGSKLLPFQRTGSGENINSGSGQQFPNAYAFAALRTDGSIAVWGAGNVGGANAPTRSGFVEIASNQYAFAALHQDGTISAWGDPNPGGVGAPTGNGFVSISASAGAFAALKSDGTVVTWGVGNRGGIGALPGNDYARIFSTRDAFAALKRDGSIVYWGWGAAGVTSVGGPGYQEIVAARWAFAALKEDGSIISWGDAGRGGSGAPTDKGFVKLFSTGHAFAALNKDGRVVSWGEAGWGGTGAPTRDGFVSVYGNAATFVALHRDGSLASWGAGGTKPPAGTNYVNVYSTIDGFTALTSDGKVVTWGGVRGVVAPKDSGYVRVFGNNAAFAALRADGSIAAWGAEDHGGVGAPAGTGFVHIYASGTAFSALKNDGTIVSWGNKDHGGVGAPTGNNFMAIQSVMVAPPYYAAGTAIDFVASTKLEFAQSLDARGLGVSYRISAGALPSGLTLNPSTGNVSGKPLVGGQYTFTIQATNDAGSVSRKYNLRVLGSGVLPTQRLGSGSSSYTGTSVQFPNLGAFAAITKTGEIVAWGSPGSGGAGAPSGTGFAEIFGTEVAFAALRKDGSIVSWGQADGGGQGAPVGKGFVTIASNQRAFAALRDDGSIAAWGQGGYGGTGAPTGNGYVAIFATRAAFAAIKTDGTIVTWGSGGWGGVGAPAKSGFVQIQSGGLAFAALNQDGTISSWGDPNYGGKGAPSGNGFVRIYSTEGAFSALRQDGSIVAWGNTGVGGSGAPSGKGFVDIVSNPFAFTAKKADGSLVSWGNGNWGGVGTPSGTGFGQVVSATIGFAAIKSDGSLALWPGNPPAAKDVVRLVSNSRSYVALKSDGTLLCWGDPDWGGTGAPTGNGFTDVYATGAGFVAVRTNGTLASWGNFGPNAVLAPAGREVVMVQSALVSRPYFVPGSPDLIQIVPGKAFNQKLDARGLDLTYEVISGNLPEGLSLDSRTGVLSGTPTGKGLGAFTVRVSNEAGAVTRVFGIGSEDSNLVFNGDFELGNVGFTTDYIFSKGDIGGAQWYDVLNNPAQGRPRDINPPSYTDHTSGKGLMMAANGAVSPNKVVWAQTVDVVPGKSYDFSMWISSWYAGNPAKLDIQFNGVSIGAPVAPSSVGPWAQFKTVWNSGASNQVVIKIIETGRADIGSDFALDDISLTLSKSAAPAFTSVDTATFVAGKQGAFQVTASGTPSPTISLAEGKLPAGMTLNGSGLLSGTPEAGTGGTYSLQLKASNGIGVDAVQTFTLVVQQAPVFTSAPSAAFQVGVDGKFQVLVQAVPGAKISLATGALPNGLSFDAVSGLVSGKAIAGTGGVYKLTLKASNALGEATQAFTLTVTESPAITSPNRATFELGKANAFQVTASGYPAAQITLASGKLPRGVTLSPDGRLSGIPSGGTNGTYQFVLKAANGASPDATQEFTLVVGQAPAITSPDKVTFVTGQNGVFQIRTTGSPAPTLSIVEGVLPKGLVLDSTGKLSGSPAEGTGGIFKVTLESNNGVGSAARQILTITVNQPAKIVSPAVAQFQVGQSGRFQVETTGYPKPVVSLVSRQLPAGLSMDSSGLITGTPAAGTQGTYNLLIRATNQVGAVATQTFVLTVVDSAPSKNLLQNGDFEQGNTGFISQYRYSKGAVNYSQTYDIVTDPVKAGMGNSGWASYGDHTTGKGMMMVLTGSPTEGQVAWSQTLDVTPNGKYQFSLWVSSWLTTNPGTLEIRLNGVSMNKLQSPGTTGKWQQVTVDWNAGASKTLKIEILNKTPSYMGSHIALDDISLVSIQ